MPPPVGKNSMSGNHRNETVFFLVSPPLTGMTNQVARCFSKKYFRVTVKVA